MKKGLLLQKIKGGLIVSCQALPGEPLYRKDDSIMYLMARAAKQAGAAAIRTNGVKDVKAVKKETGLPVIGLIKKPYEGYEGYITMTENEVSALKKAGADIIAMDCTLRKRGDGRTVGEFLTEMKEKYPDVLFMADISTYEEGVNAWNFGADLVGTTLSGYTPYSAKLHGPDYQLVKDLSSKITIPVLAEGKIHEPKQALRMMQLGAYAVVVGGAITRPYEIAGRFVSAIQK